MVIGRIVMIRERLQEILDTLKRIENSLFIHTANDVAHRRTVPLVKSLSYPDLNRILKDSIGDRIKIDTDIKPYHVFVIVGDHYIDLSGFVADALNVLSMVVPVGLSYDIISFTEYIKLLIRKVAHEEYDAMVLCKEMKEYLQNKSPAGHFIS